METETTPAAEVVVEENSESKDESMKELDLRCANLWRLMLKGSGLFEDDKEQNE